MILSVCEVKSTQEKNIGFFIYIFVVEMRIHDRSQDCFLTNIFLIMCALAAQCKRYNKQHLKEVAIITNVVYQLLTF